MRVLVAPFTPPDGEARAAGGEQVPSRDVSRAPTLSPGPPLPVSRPLLEGARPVVRRPSFKGDEEAMRPLSSRRPPPARSPPPPGRPRAGRGRDGGPSSGASVSRDARAEGSPGG